MFKRFRLKLSDHIIVHAGSLPFEEIRQCDVVNDADDLIV